MGDGSHHWCFLVQLKQQFSLDILMWKYQGFATSHTMPAKSNIMVAEVWWFEQASFGWPFYIFEIGTVTNEKYKVEFLGPYVYIFSCIVHSQFILMDNSVKPHRVLLINEFLERKNILRTDWLSRSPDLNVVEHDFDALRRAMPHREPSNV